MAFFDKMLNAMRLNSDEDDDEFYNDEYLDDEDEDEYEPPVRRRGFRKEEPQEETVFEKRQSARERNQVKNPQKVTPMRAVKKSQGGNVPMEVCVIKPASVEDAREITETLLNNRTVVLNLEGLDLDVAQRIIDFTSGSCFAIDGNLQKISNYIFLVTPTDVDISGDLQDLLNTSFDASSMRSRF